MCLFTRFCSAFAELQTDMTRLERDISGRSGIPFLSYRDFAMRMLFPSANVEDHPVVVGLDDITCRNESRMRGLSELNRLVEQRTFLLSFIRTLEAQEKFVVKDRVKVASLLSVVLQNRLVYFTE